MDDLAKRSGVSRAMLSKIERGAASPTIGLLCKITGALGVPLTRLVAEPSDGRGRAIRRGAMRPLTDTLSGVTRTSLSTELPEWGIELVRYDLPPGSSTGDCGGCGCGIREIFHVTAGKIDITSCGHADIIGPGEAYLLEGQGEGYQIRNTGDVPAQFYIVIDRRSVR
ncbi:MAG: helix-turn-helix transcriptional regulator [Deltaproteobacteria bacterium]|nr:helix-turn-helix transcriptional regulator [Deltaproteobacteria bacterium]